MGKRFWGLWVGGCLGLGPGLSAIAQPAPDRPAPIYGVAEPTCVSQTQIGLNRCAVRWAKTAETLRSLIDSEVNADWAVADRAELASIEKSWQEFREAHCQEVIEPFKGGSAMAMVYHRCLAQLTNDRIADIQGVEASPLTPELAATTLTGILQKFDAGAPNGQKQWEVYRSRQCRFEAKPFSAHPIQRQTCADRLEKARIQQLFWMLSLR